MVYTWLNHLCSQLTSRFLWVITCLLSISPTGLEASWRQGPVLFLLTLCSELNSAFPPQFISTWNLRKQSHSGNRVFAEVFKVRIEMRSYCIRVSPKSKASIFISDRKGHTETGERRCFEDRDRDWNVASASQGTPGIASKSADAKREAWNASSLRASGRNQQCWYLNFGLPIS